jgi:uncharacterized YigZ family protein
MEVYQTVAKPGLSNHRVLASKHLGFSFEVSNEEECRAMVKKFKSDYFDSNHVCWAFRLGRNGVFSKFSDDGEPSGTAGRPILGAIMAAQLTQCLVLVVRYFGGTKLGTGGLIQAYRTAAEMAIQDAGIEQKEWKLNLTIGCTYEQFPAVMHFLKQHQAEKVRITQTNVCYLVYTLNLGQKEIVNQWLTDHNIQGHWQEIIEESSAAQ